MQTVQPTGTISPFAGKMAGDGQPMKTGAPSAEILSRVTISGGSKSSSKDQRVYLRCACEVCVRECMCITISKLDQTISI